MYKKLRFLAGAFALIVGASAQVAPTHFAGCGTSAPPQQWEAWMQDKINEYETGNGPQKKVVSTVIPVVVHVIHAGETYGTYPNVDSNQIKSQIAILNADFAGTGLNSGNVPAVFASLKANTGISFCLAAKDQQDVPMIEKGIHRVNINNFTWTNPNTPNLDLKNYFNTVIMPNTIWDPTKYLNIWISDKDNGYAINGFANYPAGSGLSGLFSGNIATTGNDGIWVYTKAFGNIGVTAPYDLGRTATHELGHWLGLRHIWGDGNCLSDYVNDTPIQKSAHYGSPTHPINIDACGPNSAPNGEMFMNFMDMTEDAAKYMFTTQQSQRMQVAMSQCLSRNALGTHNKCNPAVNTAPSSSAVANFQLDPNMCLGNTVYPFNQSSGNPPPTFLWNSSPALNFIPNANVASPGISITNPGTYTLSLVASNSVSSSSYSMVVTAFSGCVQLPVCIDTLKCIKATDTLTSYKLNNDPNVGACASGFAGYLTGTNCYKDREFAQFFAPTMYTAVPNPQVNSAIVLFDSLGTNCVNLATQISCKIYGGTAAQGPIGFMALKNDSLGKIAAAPKVLAIGYVGRPNFAPLTNSKIIPFKFDFNVPVLINNVSGFFVSVASPTNNVTDSINIFSSTRYSSIVDSASWVLQFSNSWKNIKSLRKQKVQLAILPQITCSSVNGIEELQSDLAQGFNVMPNPGSGLFQLVFTLREMQDLSVIVRNNLGQELTNARLSNVQNNVVQLDLSNYANGVYLIEIQNKGEKLVKKIILQH